MRLTKLLSKFRNALTQLYGAISLGGRTAAARRRLDESLQPRPGTFDASIGAAITRDVRSSHLARARKNTRGLPKGYSVHQARRARLLMRSMKAREKASEIHLEAAQQFYDDVKACNALRTRIRRPRWVQEGLLAGVASRSFLQRVMPAWRKLSPKQIQAKVRYALEAARQTGRIAYRKPRKPTGPRMVTATATRRSDGTLVVKPGPAYSIVGI